MRAITLNLALTICLLPSVALAQNHPPIANAGADQSIFIGDSIMLQGSATDPDGDTIVGWLWTITAKPLGSSPLFGLTNVSNPVFTPDMLGDYTFSLLASDGMAVSLPDFVTISVVQNQPPVAVASSDVTSGPAPLTVNFDGSGSFDPEGGVLSFAWFFGDGSPSPATAITSHVYTLPGTYVARLNVRDNVGQSANDTILITVVPPANNPPVASPSATPSSGSAPLTVSFVSNASDPDGDPLSITWDFGDPTSANNTSSAANPTHVYETPGSYTATLTVSDGSSSPSWALAIDVTIELRVKKARIRWRTGTGLGRVHVRGEFAGAMPAPGDTIAVSVDGLVLMAQPFSAFTQARRRPALYKFHDKGITLKLWFDDWRFKITRSKINVTSIDNSDGVDFDLVIGAAFGAENILMDQPRPTTLCYKSPNP